MKLNEIRDKPGARHARTRVGRGMGSGTGKTGGRGQKGQKSRSGVSLVGFEGGQMPLYRRLPKRGFNNPFTKYYDIVNVGRLQKAVDEKKLDSKNTIDAAVLKAAGLAGGAKDGVRILGDGELSAKLDIDVAGASKSAIAAIEKAGGKIVVVEKIEKAVKKGRIPKRATALNDADGKGADQAAAEAPAADAPAPDEDDAAPADTAPDDAAPDDAARDDEN